MSNSHPQLGQTVQGPAPGSRRRMSGIARKEALAGYVAISPWLLGFLIFQLVPIVSAFYISSTEWRILSTPEFIGLRNFDKLLFQDDLFWQSVKVTVIYVIFRVPFSAMLSLALALLMNQRLLGRRVFRTIYYLPAVIPLVAVSMMWIWIFNPEYGVLNTLLRVFGIEGPPWIFSSRWALPALIIMSLWQVGTGMVIFLAGLQGIPAHLYEAATIDGANTWQKFLKVTLPMLSPVVLFALIMNVIGSFQIFTQAYIMTGGGPGNATLFLVLYIYRNAFEWFHMGYASALAWILFLVVLVISLAVLRSSEHWVHYEGRIGGA